MKTIHKSELAVEDKQTIPMREGAQLLRVDVQRGKVCLWAMVDTMDPTTYRVIYIRGTGHDAHGLVASQYIGTFMLSNGELVFHVFDGGEE